MTSFIVLPTREQAAQLARRRALSAARWLAEAAGVAVISVGVGIAYEPAGFMVAGGYLILIANMQRED